MKIRFLVTATTGSLITNLKILRRYVEALIRHFTWRKIWNLVKVEWAYFRQKPVINAYPYVLKVESTNICNLRCPFCLDRDRSAFEKGRGFGRMTLDEFKKIVDTLGPYTIRMNLYGSGEPVLFPEIYDMVSYAASKDIGVAISANLSNFKKENTDKLLTCGLEHLIISCHGASRETYLKYNVGGNFERVMESMRHIVQRRKELGRKLPFLDWQFLLFSHNQHEKPLAKKLAKEIGVDIIRFVLPNIPPEYKEEWRPRLDGLPPPKQTEQAPETQEGKKPEPQAEKPPMDPKKVKLKIHRCSWPYRSIFFNWDGGILPCCHDQVDNTKDLGHVNDLDDFMALWNGDKYRQARQLANFRQNPDHAPIPMSCNNCVMPQTPFKAVERGFPLPDKLFKRVKPLVDTPDRSDED
ncbi:MAG: radical SAM protein [Planctomycetota bacterium]|jgi:MoaA/NifB/PqqE/SkfB family radical SAM enzyme